MAVALDVAVFRALVDDPALDGVDPAPMTPAGAFGIGRANAGTGEKQAEGQSPQSERKASRA